MRVEYERTGGFAGMRIAASFDLAELQPAEAAETRQLIESAGFRDLPEDISDGAAIPDQFTHKITITGDTWKHTVVTTDNSMPDSLQPLVEKLNLLARQHRG